MEGTAYIKCDIEMDVKAPTEKVAAAWLSAALRKLADRIDREDFEDGHHDVTDRHGKKLGNIYFDFSEEDWQGPE